jgi:hypothetical protein
MILALSMIVRVFAAGLEDLSKMDPGLAAMDD